MNKNPTQLSFLKSYCIDKDVSKIKILGHTGKSIFYALEEFARLRDDEGLHSGVDVKLLLRDEGVESPKRRVQIGTAKRIIKQLEEYAWLRIEIRFYSAIQTLRGAIVESRDGSKHTYFSAYQWNLPAPHKTAHTNPHPIKTSAVKWGKVIESGDGKNDWDELARLIENWFDYYWGPGLVHTIGFDFDDTILDTYNDKIEAWIYAVDETLKKPGNAAHFLPEFIEHWGRSDGDKFTYVKQLVDIYAGSEEILRYLLKDEAPRAISDFLETKRKTYRDNALFPRNRTEQDLAAHIAAKLFPYARSALNRLVGLGYSLAVASLTDEENIEKALKIAEISCIDTIVGKNEYKDRELSKYLAEKIYLLRKIANLAGVPVSRVLYIGDHPRDELAAVEVGASFIHARLIRQVDASDDADTLWFEDYGKLPGLVSEVESRVKARDIMPQRPKHYA